MVNMNENIVLIAEEKFYRPERELWLQNGKAYIRLSKIFGCAFLDFIF